MAGEISGPQLGIVFSENFSVVTHGRFDVNTRQPQKSGTARRPGIDSDEPTSCPTGVEGISSSSRPYHTLPVVWHLEHSR